MATRAINRKNTLTAGQNSKQFRTNVSNKTFTESAQTVFSSIDAEIVILINSLVKIACLKREPMGKLLN